MSDRIIKGTISGLEILGILLVLVGMATCAGVRQVAHSIQNVADALEQPRAD